MNRSELRMNVTNIYVCARLARILRVINNKGVAV
jgi:hypothetical protein